MITQEVTIINKLGLHARAASSFVKTASAFASTVQVTRARTQADGKSIMAMMMLEATCGSTITLSIDGADEDDAMAALIEIIEERFGEAE